jgi:Uma2 family endonuclease
MQLGRGQVLARIGWFSEKRRLGWAFPADNGFQCFGHDPGRVRRPDVSFVRFGRFSGELLPTGWAKIPPDLAVEVVSPNDTVYELEDKLEDYRKVGVPLIWLVYPNLRTVRVYRADGSTSHLHEDDELSGEGIIPGFRCSVREIFPPREPSLEAQPSPTAPNGHQ